MRENQLNIAMLMHERITTSARFSAISCEDIIDGEFLYFFTIEPIASPTPAPAKAPSARTMRISKAFILVNFSSPDFDKFLFFSYDRFSGIATWIIKFSSILLLSYFNGLSRL